MLRPLQHLFTGRFRHTFPGDSEAPKVKRPTSDTNHSAVAPVAPILPQEIIDEILDHLAADTDRSYPLEFSLRSCSLVCKSWVEPSRRHLFRELYFGTKEMWKWPQVFPVPEQSPANHVRSIHLKFQGSCPTLHKIIKRIQGFTNLKMIAVYKVREGEPLWTSWLVGLPQSVTTLIMLEDSVTLWQIREVIAQLPNLNYLSLSGTLHRTDRSRLRGIGTTLTGKFGGYFALSGSSSWCDDTDIVNMLLEVPTGLHFTEVRSWACLYSTVRLVEACSKTLVKLFYVVNKQDGHEVSDWEFNFTRFSNLEEITFIIGRTPGDLLWIPRALSTVKPITSPRFSVLNLMPGYELPHPIPAHYRLWLRNVTRLTEEVSRIEHEFMGTVKVTWYPEVDISPAPGLVAATA